MAENDKIKEAGLDRRQFFIKVGLGSVAIAAAGTAAFA